MMRAPQEGVRRTTARFRFYGQLNDFMPPARKGKFFSHTVKGGPSVKDTVEALGVPHTEIDALFAGDKNIRFSYQLKDGEKITAFPPRYPIRSSRRRHLIPKTPKRCRFVVDSHLGRLVRHLRLLGFDSVYRKIFPDAEIVKISVVQNRIVLTRDIGLLKNGAVKRGYWVRHADAGRQIKEVIRRYDLIPGFKPFTRCLQCNGLIGPVPKERITQRLPEQVRLYYNSFYRCRSCRKIYWQGSHCDKLVRLVSRLKKMPGPSGK